jgi:WD40 repeat protein
MVLKELSQFRVMDTSLWRVTGSWSSQGRADQLALDEDGRLLATAELSKDKEIRIWDVVEGKLLRRLELSGPVKVMAMSPVSRQLVTATEPQVSVEARLTLWSMESGEVVRHFTDLEGRVVSLAFSGDGLTLAAATDSDVTLFNVATGERVATAPGVETTNAVALDYSGRQLAIAGCEIGEVMSSRGGSQYFPGVVLVKDLTEGRPSPRLHGHDEPIDVVAFERRVIERRMATGSADGTIRVWQLTGGRHLWTLAGKTAPVLTYSFHPHGSWLAIGILRPAHADRTGRRTFVEQLHHSLVTNAPLDILSWNLRDDGQPKGFALGATSVSLVPESGRVAAAYAREILPEATMRAHANADRRRPIQVLDLSSGAEIASFLPEEETLAVALSPDGHWVARGGFEGNVELWDVSRRAGSRAWTHDNLHEGYGIIFLGFSPDGKWLAFIDDESYALGLWDRASGRDVRTEELNPLRFFDFSPVGPAVAWGHDSIKWANFHTRAHRSIKASDEIDLIYYVEFSPDGRRLVAAGEHIIYLIEIETTEILEQWESKHSLPTFSPDGRFLAITSEAGVELIDLRTLESRGVPGAGVCLFTPDGNRILSAGEDDRIRIWDTAPAERCWARSSRAKVALIGS